jgi:hypothetical protein
MKYHFCNPEMTLPKEHRESFDIKRTHRGNGLSPWLRELPNVVCLDKTYQSVVSNSCKREAEMASAQRHDVDFYSWTQEQAALLRAAPPAACSLDLDNLAEEIEDMGRSEIRAITSLLHQTLAHLLKIAIFPKSRDRDHWLKEILAFQGDAALTFSPGLRQRLDLPAIWRVAKNGATRLLESSGVTVPVLPETGPLALDDLIDPEFDPLHAVEVITTSVQAIQAITPGK